MTDKLTVYADPELGRYGYEEKAWFRPDVRLAAFMAEVLSWLLEQLDGRLAYIDIDIHQGDGVYQAFEAEPRVFIADMHEDPSTLWPSQTSCAAGGCWCSAAAATR